MDGNDGRCYIVGYKGTRRGTGKEEGNVLGFRGRQCGMFIKL